MDVLDMGGLGSTRFLAEERRHDGRHILTIDLIRDSNGNIYVDPTHRVATPTAIHSGQGHEG